MTKSVAMIGLLSLVLTVMMSFAPAYADIAGPKISGGWKPPVAAPKPPGNPTASPGNLPGFGSFLGGNSPLKTTADDGINAVALMMLAGGLFWYSRKQHQGAYLQTAP